MDLSGFVNRADLKESENAVRRELLEVENRLIKWGVGLALGQAALITALVKLL